MQKQRLILFAIIVLMVWGVLAIFGDRVLESYIETQAKSLLKTDVEIDGLRLYLRDPAISFEALRVTDPNDPSINLFETGWVGFYIEPLPLLKKRIEIKEIKITKIRLATTRQETATRGGTRATQREPWADALLNALKDTILEEGIDLAALDRLSQLESVLEESKTNWLAHLQRHELEADSLYESIFGQEIETQIKTAEIRVSSISEFADGRALHQRITTFRDSLALTSEHLTAETKRLLSRIDELIVETNESTDRFHNALKDTFSVYAIEEAIEPYQVSLALFGQRLYTTVDRVLTFISILRMCMPLRNAVEIPPKLQLTKEQKSQTIHYPGKSSEPIFSIGRITVMDPPRRRPLATPRSEVPGKTNETQEIQGQITGVRSHPTSNDYPLTFELEVLLAGPTVYTFSGVIDRTQKLPGEAFQLVSRGKELIRVGLGNRPYLPSELIVHHGNMGLMIHFEGESTTFTFGISASGFEIRMPKLADPDPLAQAMGKAAHELLQFFVMAKGSGNADSFQLDVASNLGEKLAKIINQYGHEKTGSRAYPGSRQLESVKAQQQRTLKSLQENRSRALTRLRQSDERIQRVLRRLEHELGESENTSE